MATMFEGKMHAHNVFLNPELIDEQKMRDDATKRYKKEDKLTLFHEHKFTESCKDRGHYSWPEGVEPPRARRSLNPTDTILIPTN